MTTITRLLSLAISTALAGSLLAQNNECSGAIQAWVGTNGPFTNVGATTSLPAWPCGTGGKDLWYRFDTTAAGSVTINTCGAAFDTTLQVFSGSCGALTSLGCNDDSCGTASSLTVPVSVDTYFVRVGGFNGAAGIFSLSINGPVTGSAATNTKLGTGCVRAFTSFYESFNNLSPFDLNGTSMTYTPSGGGYFVFTGATAFVPPSANAAVLPLFDDSEYTVPLAAPFSTPTGSASSLTVCSNGMISVAFGNGTPTGGWPGIVDSPQTAWFTLTDLDPSILFGGRVKFEQVGTKAIVTWDGVWNFMGTSAAQANTFQYQFDTSNGNVHVVYQNINAGGWSHFVGYSPGGTSLDPGTRDLSATTPFQTAATDLPGLTLDATTRPILGSNWSLEVSNIPVTGTLGVDIIGFTDPGLDDLTFLGLPGCGLRSSLEVLSPWAPFAATHSYALAIPANPTLLNYHLFTTSAVFVPGANAFGAVTANGIDGKLGHN